MNRSAYVLLTAAKNEEAYIGEAIRSVIRQSVLPLAWFIVDDGSTDGTARVVKEFSACHPFIQLHSAGAGKARSFGSQYKAICAAYEIAKGLEFEFVGVHDADIAPMGDDYYETILKGFRENPRLGIAGGYVYELKKGEWKCRSTNSPASVAGGIQLFRRTCFDAIGGYTPLGLGGSDWLAQIEAKMAGWDSIAFTNLPVRHYRPTSSANGRVRGWVREGQLGASFGSHPLFEFFKCIRRAAIRPYLLAGMFRLCGYTWWKCSGRQPLIPPDRVKFLRGEQISRLLSLVGRPVDRWKVGRVDPWMQ